MKLRNLTRSLLFVVATWQGAFAQAPRSAATPIPVVTGPIAVTATSYPLMAAHRTLGAPDLPNLGYVEEEFIVAGTANVYDWLTDGSLKVLASNGSYATRILVRRPVSASKFSGNVVIETMNTARRYDWAMMWGYMHDGLIERGDAWIGVTMPSGVAALTKLIPRDMQDCRSRIRRRLLLARVAMPIRSRTRKRACAGTC